VSAATIIAAAVMFGGFLVEQLAGRIRRRKDLDDFKDTGVNLVIGAGYLVSAAGASAVTALVFTAIWDASPIRWEALGPSRWLVLMLAEDCLYYWSHRASHTFRLMWASHVVHHNSPVLNLSTGMRNSWVGGWIDWVFFVPLVALGFHPLEVAVVQAIGTAFDFCAHTPYFPRWRWLDLVFNSPSNHRVHHAREPANKNFGGLLIIWDRLFGTYAAEPREGVAYGIDRMPSKPYNPLHLEFSLWRELFADAISHVRSPSRPHCSKQ
jgi:sterol desaturase/sphingolipid hydroxylase (fatty acid hydroxylase superfamily)